MHFYQNLRPQNEISGAVDDEHSLGNRLDLFAPIGASGSVRAFQRLLHGGGLPRRSTTCSFGRGQPTRRPVDDPPPVYGFLRQ